MLNFDSILIFSENAKKLAEFYEKVFQSKPGWTGGDFTGFKVGNSYVMVGPHNKVKGKNKEPERIMFNFSTKDVHGEYERILKLGAKSIAKPYHPGEEPKMWLATLEDPDGNFFQLGTPMEPQWSEKLDLYWYNT